MLSVIILLIPSLNAMNIDLRGMVVDYPDVSLTMQKPSAFGALPKLVASGYKL